MEINLMALNVGNSRLQVGVFVAGKLEYVTRIPHTSRADWEGRLAEAWAKIKDRENAAIAAASVNPAAAEAIEAVAAKVTGTKVEWIGVGRDIAPPIKILTEHPEQTGIDRVLNVAAAYEQMGKACVVVDAGTAVTVDLCNDEGAFVGGAIAPGASTQLWSMHERASKLPEVEFAVPAGPVGKGTSAAMLSGVYHGIRGMVRELAEAYATELGTWPDLIATGGDAVKLFEGWELVHAIAPDLTLYGIALAYADHHIKQGT